LARGGATRCRRPTPLLLRAILPPGSNSPPDVPVRAALHAFGRRDGHAGVLLPRQGAGDRPGGPWYVRHEPYGEWAHAETRVRGAGRLLAVAHDKVSATDPSGDFIPDQDIRLINREHVVDGTCQTRGPRIR